MNNDVNIRPFVFGFIAIVGLILFFTLWPFVQVNAGERGVVMNFGRVQEQVLDEGLHWRTPFVQSVKKISVRTQKSDVKASGASKDLQDVTMEIVVTWSIDASKVNHVYQTIGDEDSVFQKIVSPAVSEVVKASTAQKTAEEIITKRVELKTDIDKLMQERLLKNGIILADVSLVDVKFSEQFNAAIEAKQVADQDAQKAKFIADKAIQEANALVNQAKGQAEAQRLQQQTLTPELLQKMAIERWNGILPVYFGSSNPLPFLNLK